MSIIDGISSEHSLSHLGLLYHTGDGDYYHIHSDFTKDIARNIVNRTVRNLHPKLLLVIDRNMSLSKLEDE